MTIGIYVRALVSKTTDNYIITYARGHVVLLASMRNYHLRIGQLIGPVLITTHNFKALRFSIFLTLLTCVYYALKPCSSTGPRMGGNTIRHAVLKGEWVREFGSFPRYGDPNIDPKIIESLLLGPPRKVPLILQNPMYV